MSQATRAQQVRVGVSAMVLIRSSIGRDASNPRFLIGKRLNAHGAERYAFPGGHLEFGETPLECCAREVREETGLQVDGCRIFAFTNDFMPVDGKHYLTLHVACYRVDERCEPVNMEPHKCAGWAWVDWQTAVEMAAEDKLFTPTANLIRQERDIQSLLT